jgi:cytochrome P450
VEAQLAADFIFSNTIVTLGDPPRHTAVRRILHEGFKPSTIASFEPAIREIIAKHVSLLPLQGSFDLAGEFAHFIPLEVGMYVTGFPLSENDKLKRWLADQVAFFAGTAYLSEQQLIDHGRSYADAITYLRELVQLRRAEPRNDLISIMTRRDAHGDTLTDDEIAAQTIGLIAAGWENTSNAITNIVRALLEEPSQWESFVRGDVDVDQIIAEGLRYDTSVPGLFRTVAKDATVGSVTFSRGDRIFLFYASANHDDTHFPLPKEFELDRSNARKHLGFGHGIHNCIGISLAKLELSLVLELLRERYPRLRLADASAPPRYRQISQHRGQETLLLLSD